MLAAFCNVCADSRFSSAKFVEHWILYDKWVIGVIQELVGTCGEGIPGRSAIQRGMELVAKYGLDCCCDRAMLQSNYNQDMKAISSRRPQCVVSVMCSKTTSRRVGGVGRLGRRGGFQVSLGYELGLGGGWVGVIILMRGPMKRFTTSDFGVMYEYQQVNIAGYRTNF